MVSSLEKLYENLCQNLMVFLHEQVSNEKVAASYSLIFVAYVFSILFKSNGKHSSESLTMNFWNNTNN